VLTRFIPSVERPGRNVPAAALPIETSFTSDSQSVIPLIQINRGTLTNHMPREMAKGQFAAARSRRM
jgi:hypothetical protein